MKKISFSIPYNKFHNSSLVRFLFSLSQNRSYVVLNILNLQHCLSFLFVDVNLFFNEQHIDKTVYPKEISVILFRLSIYTYVSSIDVN